VSLYCCPVALTNSLCSIFVYKLYSTPAIRYVIVCQICPRYIHCILVFSYLCLIWHPISKNRSTPKLKFFMFVYIRHIYTKKKLFGKHNLKKIDPFPNSPLFTSPFVCFLFRNILNYFQHGQFCAFGRDEGLARQPSYPIGDVQSILHPHCNGQRCERPFCQCT
jgi:hypothetical protein